ncbi:uncharacterized protein LOC143525119 isoform X3 [Brachyhypopomus gauderio]|uniref:uncharacterized protein LOC143525119 isoform X3 n=1 Tax=Brachyhypopomus gauderio TaxID=698409 RepID=UPI004042E9D1
MGLQLTLILTCLFCYKAFALTCSQHTLEQSPGICTQTVGGCAGIRVTLTTEGAGAPPMDLELKSCVAPAECVNGSLNLGLVKIVTNCCNTDLCNNQTVAGQPEQPPNGKRCYTCDGHTCSGNITCQGDENQCISASVPAGGNNMPMKGCATKSMCDGIASLQQKFGIMIMSCCVGNLCNPDPSPSPKPNPSPSPSPSPKPNSSPSPSPKPNSSLKPNPSPNTSPKPNSSLKPSTSPKPNSSLKPNPSPKPNSSLKPSTSPKPNSSLKPSTSPKTNSSLKPSTSPKTNSSLKPNPSTSPKPNSSLKPSPSSKPNSSLKPNPSPSTSPKPSPSTSPKPNPRTSPSPNNGNMVNLSLFLMLGPLLPSFFFH